MRAISSPNTELQNLIMELRKAATTQKAMIWKAIAADLSRPSRERRVVNLSRINFSTEDNDVIVVPGKVLSSGDIDHKVKVAAFSFSGSAKQKISQAKGSVMTIEELLKSNPKGKGVKIIG